MNPDDLLKSLKQIQKGVRPSPVAKTTTTTSSSGWKLPNIKSGNVSATTESTGPSGLKGAALKVATKTVGTVLKPLIIVDTPRRAIISGVREVVDVLDSDPETNASLSDFLKQSKDITYGFGTAFPIKNKWGGRILGFIGDVALDPTTYATLGGAVPAKASVKAIISGGKVLAEGGKTRALLGGIKYVNGREGRLALANLSKGRMEAMGEAGIRTFAKDEIGKVFQDVAAQGKKALPGYLRDDLGIRGPGIYYFGSRLKVPGSGPIGALLENAITGARLSLVKNAIGQSVMKYVTPDGTFQALYIDNQSVLKDRVSLASGILENGDSMTPQEALDAGVRLEMAQQQRTITAKNREYVTQQVLRVVADPDMEANKLSIASILETEGALESADDVIRPLGEKIRNFFNGRFDDVQRSANEISPEYGAKFVRRKNYIPHMESDDAIVDRLKMGEEAWDARTGGAAIDDSHKFASSYRRRSLQPGDNFFGHTIENRAYTLDELNDMAKNPGSLLNPKTKELFEPLTYNFYENDMVKILQKYSEHFAQQQGHNAYMLKAVQGGGDFLRVLKKDAASDPLLAIDSSDAVGELTFRSITAAGKVGTEAAASVAPLVVEPHVDMYKRLLEKIGRIKSEGGIPVSGGGFVADVMDMNPIAIRRKALNELSQETGLGLAELDQILSVNKTYVYETILDEAADNRNVVRVFNGKSVTIKEILAENPGKSFDELIAINKQEQVALMRGTGMPKSVAPTSVVSELTTTLSANQNVVEALNNFGSTLNKLKNVFENPPEMLLNILDGYEKLRDKLVNNINSEGIVGETVSQTQALARDLQRMVEMGNYVPKRATVVNSAEAGTRLGFDNVVDKKTVGSIQALIKNLTVNDADTIDRAIAVALRDVFNGVDKQLFASDEAKFGIIKALFKKAEKLKNVKRVNLKKPNLSKTVIAKDSLRYGFALQDMQIFGNIIKGIDERVKQYAQFNFGPSVLGKQEIEDIVADVTLSYVFQSERELARVTKTQNLVQKAIREWYDYDEVAFREQVSVIKELIPDLDLPLNTEEDLTRFVQVYLGDAVNDGLLETQRKLLRQRVLDLESNPFSDSVTQTVLGREPKTALEISNEVIRIKKTVNIKITKVTTESQRAAQLKKYPQNEQKLFNEHLKRLDVKRKDIEKRLQKILLRQTQVKKIQTVEQNVRTSIFGKITKYINDTNLSQWFRPQPVTATDSLSTRFRDFFLESMPKVLGKNERYSNLDDITQKFVNENNPAFDLLDILLTKNPDAIADTADFEIALDIAFSNSARALRSEARKISKRTDITNYDDLRSFLFEEAGASQRTNKQVADGLFASLMNDFTNDVAQISKSTVDELNRDVLIANRAMLLAEQEIEQLRIQVDELLPDKYFARFQNSILPERAGLALGEPTEVPLANRINPETGEITGNQNLAANKQMLLEENDFYPQAKAVLNRMQNLQQLSGIDGNIVDWTFGKRIEFLYNNKPMSFTPEEWNAFVNPRNTAYVPNDKIQYIVSRLKDEDLRRIVLGNDYTDAFIPDDEMLQKFVSYIAKQQNDAFTSEPTFLARQANIGKAWNKSDANKFLFEHNRVKNMAAEEAAKRQPKNVVTELDREIKSLDNQIDYLTTERVRTQEWWETYGASERAVEAVNVLQQRTNKLVRLTNLEYSDVYQGSSKAVPEGLKPRPTAGSPDYTNLLILGVPENVLNSPNVKVLNDWMATHPEIFNSILANFNDIQISDLDEFILMIPTTRAMRDRQVEILQIIKRNNLQTKGTKGKKISELIREKQKLFRTPDEDQVLIKRVAQQQKQRAKIQEIEKKQAAAKAVNQPTQPVKQPSVVSEYNPNIPYHQQMINVEQRTLESVASLPPEKIETINRLVQQFDSQYDEFDKAAQAEALKQAKQTKGVIASDSTVVDFDAMARIRDTETVLVNVRKRGTATPIEEVLLDTGTKEAEAMLVASRLPQAESEARLLDGLASMAKPTTRTSAFTADETGVLAMVTDGWKRLGGKFDMIEASPEFYELWSRAAYFEDPAFVRQMVKLVGGYTKFHKTYATFTPGFHVRNLIGNVFQYVLAGGQIAHYRRATEIYFEWNSAYKKGVSWKKFVKTLSPEEQVFATKARTSTLGSGGGIYSDLFQGLVPGNVIYDNPPTRALRSLGQKSDNMSRFVLGYDSAVQGMSVDMAIARTKRFYFDYEDLSKLDRAARQFIPFWIWTSRNLPLQLQNMWLNPKPYQIYNSLVRNLRDKETEQEQPLPPWLQQINAFRLPGVSAYAAPDLGFTRVQQQLEQLAMPKKFGSNLNPLLRVPLEQALGQNLFNDEELETPKDRIINVVQGSFVPISQADRLLNSYGDAKINAWLGFFGSPIKKIKKE